MIDMESIVLWVPGGKAEVITWKVLRSPSWFG